MSAPQAPGAPALLGALGSPGPAPRVDGLYRRAWRTMREHPWLLAAAITAWVLEAAFAPSFSWMGRQVVDDFSESGIQVETAARYLPWFAALLCVWACFRLGLWMARKAYQTRMVISLQRVYLAREAPEKGRNDLARVLWDAKKAEEALQIVYEEAPKISASIVAVVGWQLALAPAWFGALGVAVLPTLVAVTLFGPLVQRTSLGVLRDVNAVAEATERRALDDVHRRQESLYKSFLRFYLVYSGADVALDTLFWSGILVVVVGDLYLGLPLIPHDAQLGDPVFFWAQLKLLSAPLARIGKAYNKLKAARPALERIYEPSAERAGSG